jgi:hypothetical protein
VPVHDWTRIYAGAFHDFHHSWLEEIKRALNRVLLQPEYYALIDQFAGGLGPDVLALHRPASLFPPIIPVSGDLKPPAPARARGSVRVAERPPRTQFHVKNESRWYAGKGKVVTVRHVSNHEVVAVVELVSSGNKNSRHGINAFIRKAEELLAAGVHLTVVDVFPPGRRDPQGIHPLIWGEDVDDEFRFDPARPLTCAAYVGGLGAEAYVQSFGFGEPLPDTPLFLTATEYVDIPFEATYQAAYAEEPPAVREILEAPPAA